MEKVLGINLLPIQAIGAYAAEITYIHCTCLLS